MTDWVISGPRASRVDRALEISNAIIALPDDSVWSVEMFELEETRRDKQNRLMWHWCRQVVEQGVYHSHQNFICGMSKKELLLPMMYSSKKHYLRRRAAFVDEVLSHLSDYNVKVAVCYDLIRTSKDISVKEFAKFLTAKYFYWSERGAKLTTSDDYIHEALGSEYEELSKRFGH